MTAERPEERGPSSTSASERTMRTAKGVAALATGDVLGKIATLAYVVVAARALGPVDFGVFGFALALGTLGAMIPAWGFDLVVVQEGSADRSRLPTLLAELLAARTMTTIPVAAMLIAVELVRRGGETGLASALVMTACFVDTYADAYRAAAAVHEAQPRSAAVLVLQRVTTALTVVGSVTMGWGLLGVATCVLAGSVVGLIAMVIVVSRLGIRADIRGLTAKGVRTLISRSHIVGFSAVISALMFRINTVLLGFLASDAAVGAYSAAYRILETVLFVAWATSGAVFPVVARDPQAWRIRRGFERGLVVLTAVFLPYAVVLLLRGDDLLVLLYGEAFTSAGTPILQWLAFAPLLFGVAYLANYALIAPGPNKQILVGGLVALAVNVALNFALIPSLQGVGAAIATTMSYAIEAVVLGIYLVRAIGVPLRIRAVAASAVGTVVVLGVLVAPLPFIPALLVAGAAYCVAWWIVARLLDPEQIDVLRGLMRRSRATA